MYLLVYTKVAATAYRSLPPLLGIYFAWLTLRWSRHLLHLTRHNYPRCADVLLNARPWLETCVLWLYSWCTISTNSVIWHRTPDSEEIDNTSHARVQGSEGVDHSGFSNEHGENCADVQLLRNRHFFHVKQKSYLHLSARAVDNIDGRYDRIKEQRGLLTAV